MTFLQILEYFFLGLVQGIAEILPISSSGHLALVQALMGVNAAEEAVFAIFVHFASLVALIIFFRKLLWRIIVNTCKFLFKKDQTGKSDFLLAIYIVLASIPAGVLGYLFQDAVMATFGNLLFVGIGFLFTAAVLFAVSFLKDTKNEKYTWKNTLVAGLFQVIGILLGVSRSGLTMSGGKVARLSDEKAKEFAFLLFIPVALGSFVLSLSDIGMVFSSDTVLVFLYAISMVAAGVFTYLALIYIFKMFNVKHYKYFSIYLVLIGAFTIIYSFLR